jgi:thiol-disulfide isomerase/thioredoxin
MFTALPRRWLASVLRNWRSHLATVMMALAAMLVVNAWQTRNVPSGPAPDFALPVLLGPGAAMPSALPGAAPAALSLAQWRAAYPGQPVAIHIWSDWCPFCKAEESSITRLAQSWPVLTVASRSGNAVKVSQFMSQRGLPWVAALDPSGDVSKAYGLVAVPALVVVGADGQIRSVSTGYTTWLGMHVRLWWASVF